MLVEKINDYIQKQIRVTPCHSNRASELAHDCLRYLVYQRTIWEQKTPHDLKREHLFKLGKEMEKITIQDLCNSGLDVEQQQRDFKDKSTHITGHIDGIVNVDGDQYLLEAKSVKDFVFNSITDENSVKYSRYSFLKKYYAQLNLYLYLHGRKEQAFLLFKDKHNGGYKEVLITLDCDFCEQLLKKAETIEKHLKEDTLPDRIEYDDFLCGNCPYNHICCPSPKSEGVKFVDNEEIRTLLEEYEVLKEKAARFKIVDDLLKKELAEQDNIAVGDFHITGKWRSLTKYNVPQEIKDNYKEVSKYWVKKITRFAHNDAKEAHS